MSEKSPGLELIPLQLLDLQKCETVSDIVRAMSYCSFGARMLGEVAGSLEGMIKGGEKLTLIYDGSTGTPLSDLLERMTKEKKWFSELILPVDYIQRTRKGEKTVVVGPFSERHERIIYDRPERAIFINKEGAARPGQVKDGYFPNVVFSDPKYILPLLFHTLEERLEGKRHLVGELIDNLKCFGGLAAEICQGAETLQAMVKDEGCKVFLTMSGAMTIAKMDKVICGMIDQDMVQAVTTTGALMAHGLVEGMGLKHYKYNPAISDRQLAKQKWNRITDTIELDSNLISLGKKVVDEVLEPLAGQTISPRLLVEKIGQYLDDHLREERTIPQSAVQKNIPIFIPAFYDSELGNYFYAYNLKQKKSGGKEVLMDFNRDNDLMIKIFSEAERLGIFSIGGGVPRNFTQNVPPLMDYIQEQYGERYGFSFPKKTFSYGVRICPDPMYYGHLSGCTYDEGKSWRKMNPEGKFTEIHADATLVWPFLVKYLMETTSKRV